MPVDKFGRMSDLKTKDTGVSLTYINNNYVRSDGETPLTGSLNMRGNTLYNVADPVNPQDVVTKVYVDNTKGSGVIGRKTKDGVSIKENLDFLGKQKIKNLPDPVDEKDAVTKEYVDDKTKNLFIDKNDNIAFGLNVDMEGNKIFSLPEPATDQEPATKKYVDDLQTQYIDKRGNVKFDRNINVGNNRIFAVKDPKKDYEATNKKYVDDTINKRLQEEKDNFLPQDPATKEYVDEAIKQVAGGDLLVSKEGVFIKANGHYRATAPLDIDNHKMENLPDPVDDKDAVNKKYIDGIIENLTLKQGLIRENGGFNLVDSYINMNFNNIRNLGLPKDESDAVSRRFVDDMIKEVEEKINKRKHLIAVNTRYCGELKKGEYHFKFSGANFENCEEIVGQYDDLKGSITGFIMPHSGHIKKIICETLLFRSFENIAEFFFNLITKHKKNLQLNDLPLKKDLGYVDIEDLLKKGIDEFKKNLVESVGLKENKTILDFHGTGPFEFELVKFEKSFDEEDYLGTFGKLPKIISSVLIDKMETKVIQFNKKNVGLGGIMKHLNKDYLPLSEGDVINIKTKYSYQESGFPLNIGDNKRFLQNKLNNLITAGLNFNFTFLIELDPL